MKRILVLGLVVLSAFVFSVNAQIKESTPSSQNKDVQILKDKLASKVAELQKKEQKAVAGRVTDNKNKKISLTADDGKLFEIRLDDVITKIYNVSTGEKVEIKPGDIKKGDYIIASGPVSDKVVTANNVYKDEQFILGSGSITEVSQVESYLKVITPEKETLILDVVTGTKRFLADVKTLTEDVVALAKIKEGDTVHFVAKKTGKEQEKNRYSVTKILIIPQEYFHK